MPKDNIHYQQISTSAQADREADQDAELRDRFAMTALGGLLPSIGWKAAHKEAAQITEDAYQIADAMMQARRGKCDE